MNQLLTQLRDMAGKPDSMKIKLTEDCRKDLLWWRCLVKEYNSVFMIEIDEAIKLSLAQLLDKPFIVCAEDATLTGAGAWHGSHYWSRKLPLALQDTQIPIQVKEFMFVIVCIKLWGSHWSSQVVQIFWDNDAVCNVIAGERSTHSKMLSPLREFKFLVSSFQK